MRTSMRIASSLRIAVPFFSLASLAAATATFLACSGGTVEGVEPAADSGVTSSSGGAADASTRPAPFGLPSAADLPADQFSFLKPGGDTVCALGTDYGFAVRPGDPTKVVVEFEGGGACWNQATCNRPGSAGDGAVYKDIVTGADYTGGTQVGIRDHGNDANPLKGWTHVVVPYCSADVHWGDSEQTFDAPSGAPPGAPPGARTVQHRGAKNTAAVLEYVYSQFQAPERVFVTGCSAGGYGSIYWTPALQKHYTGAKIRHFSDSAAGVFPATFFPILSEAWGFAATFPAEVGSAGEFKTLAYLYKGIATTYPGVRLSQYNTVSDTTQGQFFNLMGGSGWQAGMLANLGELVRDVPTFREYTSDGSVHCIIEKNAFYEKTIASTKLSEWVGKIANDEAVQNVNCPECTLPN